MKKFFVIVGVIATILVSAFAGFQILKRQKASKYEATAVPYLKMVIPEISKWDPEIIKGYMPPESLERTPEEKIINIVNYLSRLGKLEKMEEPEFSQADSMGRKMGEKMVVTYKIDAHYENGDAVITVGLLEQDGSFHVQNFNINSEALK